LPIQLEDNLRTGASVVANILAAKAAAERGSWTRRRLERGPLLEDIEILRVLREVPNDDLVGRTGHGVLTIPFKIQAARRL